MNGKNMVKESRWSKIKFIGRHLMIKGDYVNLVLNGMKKSTIRLGIVKPKYDEIIIHGGGKPVALVKITKVYHKKVKELTDSDAKKDGFSSRKELLKELKRNYKYLNSNDIVTIIEFSVIKKFTELEIEQPWLGFKPVEIARIALRYCSNITVEERKVLEDLTRTESLRKTAIRLYGNINRRWKIRKVLKKALVELISKGIVKVPSSDDPTENYRSNN